MKKTLVTAAVTVLSLFAGACANPETNMDPMQRAAYLATEEAWYAAGRAVPADDCNLDAFVVVHATSKKYWELCQSDPNKSAGCATHDKLYPLRGGSVPMVVVSPKHYIEPTIIVHELLHHFLRCTTGRDPYHATVGVWQATGPGSIQDEAYITLQEQGWL